VQRVERNRGRLEARGLIRFDTTAERTCFPAVRQAARLTRYLDRAQLFCALLSGLCLTRGSCMRLLPSGAELLERDAWCFAAVVSHARRSNSPPEQ
jgi:hypothetical protein